MQAIYAASIANDADRDVAIDKVGERFNDEAMKRGREEFPEWKTQMTKVRTELSAYFSDKEANSKPHFEDSFMKETFDHCLHYVTEQKEFNRKKALLDLEAEIESNKTTYVQLLVFLIEIARQADLTEENKNLKTPFNESEFQNNKILQTLKSDDGQLASQLESVPHKDKIIENTKRIYKEQIRDDQEYQAYLIRGAGDWDADFEIIKYLLREFVSDNESNQSFFEVLSSRWRENKKPIASMVSRTLKSIYESKGEDIIIAEVSANWDEDWEFTVNLYKNYWNKSDQFSSMLSAYSKNWDIDRINPIDRICLLMAMVEMTEFKNIPIKVTINEYLELGKKYSTPKSRQFLNGMLDKLSNVLKDQGLIKKTGRGLIDNK